MTILTSFFILTVLANIVISIFVYKNNPHSATNKILAILGGFITAWLIVLYMSDNSASAAEYLFWARTSIFIAMPMSMSFFLLAHTLPQTSLQLKKRTLTLMEVSLVAVMLLNITPFTFVNATPSGSGYEVQTSIGMLPFGILSTFYSVGAVYLLFKKGRKASGKEKEQFRFVNFGILLMLGLIITTIFIPVVFFKNTNYVILAPIYTAGFLAMTAYAIIRHRLLDIRSVLARAIAFLVFIALAAAIYIAVLFVLIQNILHLQIDFFTAGTALILSLLASLTFQPIFNWLRHVSNKFFYKDQYDSKTLLSKLTHAMAKTTDLDLMMKAVLNLFMEEMGVSKAAFFIKEKGKINAVFSQGFKKNRLETTNFQNFFAKNIQSKTFIFDELEESNIKKLLRDAEISIVIPIMVKKVTVAFMILGSKLSGEIYGNYDLQFLNIFSSESGIAIQNALSYEQIKKFNAVLEKKVEERTHELKVSQKRELDKARDLAKLKDEFVFIASHELRTPVTAIKGFMQMVNEKTDSLPRDVKENLSYIGDASDHLNQLVNDLLEVSRADAGRVKIEGKLTDLKPIFESIIREITPMAKKDDIKISFSFSRDVGFAFVDDNKMKEVIMNLLSNAVKYNHKGGQVEVKVTSASNKIKIEVSDTGYGIPKEQQNKIFEKFFRASTKRTGEVLGTGLGLFITRMLVEKMGGKISFASVENKGTTFTIVLQKATKNAPKPIPTKALIGTRNIQKQPA